MKLNTLLLKITPVIFGLSILILGIQHVYYKSVNPALFPVPANFPHMICLAYGTGIILIICGLVSVMKKYRALAFLVIGVVFLLSFLLIHLPLLFDNLKNPIEWTASFETLAILSGAFLFAAHSDESVSGDSYKIYDLMEQVSKLMFGISLVVFAVQHFQYGEYVATLIPFWIPFHLFWAYFVGAGFAAAAVSLFLNIKQILAMTLLGVMFLFWVIFLHAPRVYNHVTDRNEWSSMLIALIMACISFLIMASYKHHFQVTHHTP